MHDIASEFCTWFIVIRIQLKLEDSCANHFMLVVQSCILHNAGLLTAGIHSS